MRDNTAILDDARVLVRWWWFGGAVTEESISQQLTAMADAGLGGVEAAFVYPLAVDEQPAFGSEPFLETVGFAAQRARELGLRFDLTIGSGWSFGGAHIDTAHAAKRLRWEKRAIGPEALRLTFPATWPGDQFVAAFLCEGAVGEESGEYRLISAESNEIAVPEGVGPRTVLIAMAGTTGQVIKRASLRAEGPVLDHYSRAATEHHLSAVGEPLLHAAGAENVTAVFCDSLEVYHSDWTDAMLAEFEIRRGYDPKPLLFHLSYRNSAGATFRADYHRTLSELFEENFLAVMHEWAQKHGVLFRVQNYGQPPARVSGYRHADLIEGEGWRWRGIPQTKWASSAAHHLGATVVSSETWTWINSPSFRARPLDFMGEAHEHALSGINQFIGHGWPSTPAEIADPGWAFYAAGAITDRNAWWPAAPALFSYLERLSSALRRGEHIADIGLWLPYEDTYAAFEHGKELNLWRDSERRIGEALPRLLREGGYDFDVIDAQTSIESIQSRHRVIVVPKVSLLAPEDEVQLTALADAGVPVIAVDSAVLPEVVHVDESGLLAAVQQILAPDALSGCADVGILHRRLGDGDLYFLANTGPNSRTVQPELRSPYASWRRVDLDSGEENSGVGAIALTLAPYEGAVIVTSTESDEDEKGVLPAATASHPLELREWTLRGPEGTEHRVAVPHIWEEDGLDGFVGTLTYTAQVTITGEIPQQLVLDTDDLPVPQRTARQPQSFQAHAAEALGTVARVRVNGSDAGTLWRHPFALSVGHLLREGENTIELTVSSTSVAAMRSVEWQQMYADAESVHGRRFVMQEMDRVDEPIRSGIFVVPQLRN